MCQIKSACYYQKVKKGKEKVKKGRGFFCRPKFLALGAGLFLAGLVLVLSSRDFLLNRPCGCGPDGSTASGEFDPGEKQAFWNNRWSEYPEQLLGPRPDGFLAQGSILGESADRKWIEIDLSDQKLYAHNGDRIDYEFLISSGKPWTPTIKGEFRIWLKLRYAKMSGGSKEQGNYYYLPNVPYIQYFYRDYGVHGAYWHNNFGQTMSHGCVNLAILDAEKLFYWTSPSLPAGKNAVRPTASEPGTRVVVHE